MIGARIRGLEGAISIYNRNMAEEAKNKARGNRFAGLGAADHTNSPSNLRVIVVMESCREDVL